MLRSCHQWPLLPGAPYPGESAGADVLHGMLQPGTVKLLTALDEAATSGVNCYTGHFIFAGTRESRCYNRCTSELQSSTPNATTGGIFFLKQRKEGLR